MCDTGAHYLCGTTDTTRVVHFDGEADKDLKEKYTQVLMGNLDLESVKFPKNKGVKGPILEPMARRHLWDQHSDFQHSVGHGVSHCGPVHEYPHYAFARSDTHVLSLAPGMVITNEPGYYRAGEFGIRIENMMQVVEEGEDFLGFKCMTLVPYSRELVDSNLLEKKHKR